jgi:hypothetical protein
VAKNVKMQSVNVTKNNKNTNVSSPSSKPVATLKTFLSPEVFSKALISTLKTSKHSNTFLLQLLQNLHSLPPFLHQLSVQTANRQPQPSNNSFKVQNPPQFTPHPPMLLLPTNSTANNNSMPQLLASNASIFVLRSFPQLVFSFRRPRRPLHRLSQP